MRSIQNIDLFFSSECNMNCTYCYVGKKSEESKQYNNKLRESIYNGKYAKNVYDKFKEFKNDITEFGCWGAEPTINGEYFYSLFKQLIEYFPNTERIFFSTNGFLKFNGLKPFIDSTIQLSNEFDKNMKLCIQFSLDGPSWITDNQRKLNATDHLLEALHDTICYISKLNNNKVKFDLHFKPTLNIDTIKTLVEEDKIVDYFKFFDDIWDYNEPYVTSKLLDVNFKALPTLVNPGKYTQDDGIIFKRFIDSIYELDESEFKHYRHPFFIQSIKTLEYHKDDLYNNPINIPGFGACGAGLGSYSIDFNGNVYSCHRYFSEASSPQDCLYSEARKYSTIYSKNKDRKQKQLYMLNTTYHNSLYSRRQFYEIIMLALAKNKQIDESYLYDKKKRDLLFLMIGSFLCHFGQSEDTSEIFIASTDYCKLLGNGALESLLRYFIKIGEK